MYIDRMSAHSEKSADMLKRCWSHVGFVICVAAWILGGTTSPTCAGSPGVVLSVEEVTKLAPHIKAAEQEIQNIRIDSEMWVETKADLSDPCESWQRTPIYVSSTAWFTGDWSSRGWLDPEGKPTGRVEGKARVDVHKEVLEWRDGLAPYSEKSYSMSFDGQHGRIIYHTMGPRGSPFESKEAHILPDAPRGLIFGWYRKFTGLDFTTYHIFKGKDYTLSDFFKLDNALDGEVPSNFEFALEDFQSVECIKVATKRSNCAQHSWWLDASRGFALLGRKEIRCHKDGSKQLAHMLEVKKLKKITERVWWPVELTFVSRPLKPGDPYIRKVYRALNVVANDPNFDESIFTVPFPDGYLIDDKVAGRKYRVGEDPNAP